MQTVGFPYNFSLREHLRRGLYREPSRYSLFAHGEPDLPAWRQGLTAALRAVLHVPPEAVATPEVRLVGQEDRGDHVLARLAIQVAEDLSVPCYLLSPRDPDLPAPAVLLLDARRRGKAELAGELLPPGMAGPTAPAVALCRAGMRVLVPDLPGSGERTDDTGSLQGTLLACGDSLSGWVVRESLAFLAYLHALPETPPRQVGLVGLGGAVVPALLTAALTSAVKAVAVGGDLSGLRERLLRSNCLAPGGRCATEWFPPGLLPLAETSDLAALLAPRPLLLADDETDAAGRSWTLRLVEQGYNLQGYKPRLETHTDCREEADLLELTAEFLAIWLPAEISDLPA